MLSDRPSKTKKIMNTANITVANTVEANKDKLDLKPALDFVTANLGLYELSEQHLLSGTAHSESSQQIRALVFEQAEKLVTPQLDPVSIRLTLSLLPPVLLSLSALKTVSYRYADKVPIPSFNDAGDFAGCGGLVPVSEFPRATDHPSRILIGHTEGDGTIISPTPIPKSVSTDMQAGWYYQHHVFLHELCHTLGFPWRLSGKKMLLRLQDMEGSFTLQSWWNEWEELLRSGKEPRFVSRYASTYAPSLTKEMEKKDPAKYVTAVAEQICESFAAYVLGIAPNDDGWIDFRTESFGNTELGSGALAANHKWLLIQRLFTAKLVG